MVYLNFKFLSNFILRKSFNYPATTALNWYPGHMEKGMKQMEQKLKTVDCVIEVHDARIPFTGRNPRFKSTVTGLKPHILVLNKMDLADLSNASRIRKHLLKEGIENVFFTDCRDNTCAQLKAIVPTVVEILKNTNRYNRNENADLCAMIIGVPNVGKSTLINILRSYHMRGRKATPVGAIAGITRSVMTKIKISERPLIYVLDTPGILAPSLKDLDAGLKLAMVSSMQDHLVGVVTIADYMLYWMNRENNFKYVEYLGLDGPSDNIHEVLISSAVKMNKTVKRRNVEGSYALHPDIEFVAIYLIKAFRTGLFGKVMLDSV